MRTALVVIVSFLSLATFACSAGGTSATTRTGSSSSAVATCDDACAHYLTCKGADDAANRQQCNSDCAGMGLSSDQLSQFTQSDCASAIATVEGTGQTTGGGGGGSAGSDCNGCTWDGSSCIWLSQSNWGAGPYSGAASSCDAKCCQ